MKELNHGSKCIEFTEKRLLIKKEGCFSSVIELDVTPQ